MAADTSFTRKRKQEILEQKPLSAWSDFVYSSPSSPSQDNMNFDSLLQNNNSSNNNSSNDHLDSRRHSLAVGEMNFHSYDHIKQELDMRPWDADLQNILGASIPSSWSSISSNSTMEGTQQPALHRRAMSLRLETTQPFDMHRNSISTASPTTPAFFSPSFLDALKTEDESMADLGDLSFTDTNPAPHPSLSSLSDSNSNNHNTLQDLMINQNENTNNNMSTITPSAISTDMTSLTQWFLNQPLEEQVQLNTQTGSPNSPSNTSSMSTSPSPPITPMQPISTAACDTMLFQQQHPSIPEEDEEAAEQKEIWEAKNRKHNAINMRMIQGSKNASTMKPLIQQYLLSSDPSSLGEHKVMILTSKVAQKSYGTEKRFLCPPPTTLLSGASWFTPSKTVETNSSFSSALAPPELTVHISGEQTSQQGVLEWYTASGTLLDNASISTSHSLGDTTISGKCVSKQLHINDADEKRKRVEVQVKTQLGNGAYLGTFASKGIKVISKPSKKRQSVKNMELCIHHGTTISLFNRIRSQTVSTKYLGVSTNSSSTSEGNGTCFVARTGSWDPFVIWIVDTARSLESAHQSNRTQHPTNPHYPPPPAIALHTTPGQSPVALHYNQPVVLQCISTGLVSPVMIIRKVDKGSMVLGGNRVDDLSGATGGECGDEAIGDPVSQLHKVAFQIVQDPSIAHNNKANYRPDYYQPLPTTEWTLPQSMQPVTYLACLNDVVGMHKTTVPRNFVSPRPPPPTQNIETQPSIFSSSTSTSSSWSESLLNNDFGTDLLSSIVSQQEDGKITRKRRVSCDVNVKPVSLPAKFQNSISSKNRRRVNSLNDSLPLKMEGAGRRRSSTSSDRRQSISSDTSTYQSNGSCWTEDVSDASVWTIVGTDCASYKFWIPPPSLTESASSSSPFSSTPVASDSQNPITPFPVLTQIQNDTTTLALTGENLARDLTVWFGDVKSVRTDYKCRESISCLVPELSELTESPITQPHGLQRKIPILLVRGDGVVYNTEFYYIF